MSPRDILFMLLTKTTITEIQFCFTASGQGVDATQELFTLSLCNILGSFASSMPITGSFSRSAVNHASGVKTPLGGIYTGKLIFFCFKMS